MSPPRFEKPSAALEARFAAALPDDGALEHKRMFGYPAVFVHGHYFAGLVDQRVVVKLPDGLHERLPALRDAEGFDPMGSGRAIGGTTIGPVGQTVGPAPQPYQTGSPSCAFAAASASASACRARASASSARASASRVRTSLSRR